MLNLFYTIDSANCKVEEDGIKVLAVCYKFTNGFSIQVMMWLDLDPFTLLKNQTWIFEALDGPVNIKFSPKLSKVHVDYLNINNSLAVFIKDINFESGLVGDINFIEQQRYLQTLSSLNRNLTSNNFYLGDQSIAIRNDSNQSSLLNNLEEIYIFKNTYSLILLESRRLRLSELFKCHKIMIDSSLTSQISLLVYNPKERIAPGYAIYDIRYGPNTASSNSTNATTIIADNSTNETISVVTTPNGLTINNNLTLAPVPNITTTQSATFNISSV